jgi:hypothetical protein
MADARRVNDTKVAIQGGAVGRLIISTSMTVDGVMSVEEWYVPEGEHDRAGMEQLEHAGARARRRAEVLAPSGDMGEGNAAV